EIKVRSLINQIGRGNFPENKTLTDLTTELQPQIGKAYGKETPSKDDLRYKSELLVQLLTSEVEALKNIGKYNEAIEKADQHNKTVNKLADSKSDAYAAFRIAEMESYFEFGDLKKAKRLTNRLVDLKSPAVTTEKITRAAIPVLAKSEELEDAEKAQEAYTKALGKSKVEKKYVKLAKEINEAVIKSYEKEEKENVILDLNKCIGKARTTLPNDHRFFTFLSQRGVDYLLEVNRSENTLFVEKFYLQLGSSLRQRLGTNSLYVDIFSVNFAGYYLKYSETPAKAFPLLAGQRYKRPLNTLSTQHPEYSRMVSNLMDYFTITGDFDYPIELTKSVLEALEKNPNATESDLGEKRVELAKLQTLGGYYKAAEENTDLALKTLRKGGEKKSESYVTALNTAAGLYGTIGLYNKAERQLNRAQSIYKKLETVNQELRLQSAVDLATLNTRMGNYSETEDLLDDVIKERTKLYGSASRRLIKPYRALGEVFMIRGDYPKAEKNFRQSLTITENIFGDTTLLFAETLSKMGKLYLALGNYDAAIVKTTDALKIREKLLRADHILFADLYTDLGKINQAQDADLEIVEKYYTLARDITLSNFSEKHPLYAEALKNLSYVSIRKEKYKEALALLDQADDIWRDALANQNRSSGEVARIKGDIYSLLGDIKQARKEYEKASRYFRRIFSDEHPDYLNTRSKLARAYYAVDEIGQAESILDETTEAYMDYTKTYFPTLSEDEKTKFWNKIKPDFEFYNTVAVRYSQNKEKYLKNMYDFALATKGLLLNSSIKTRNSILNSGDEELISLFKEWIGKKEFLTSTLAQSEEELAANGIDAGKLLSEIELLEKQLSERSDAFESSFEYKLYSWSDVRKALKEDEAAVEIVRYREFDDRFNEEKVRYAALIVTSETRANPQLVLLENGKAMESKFFKYHRNMTKYKLSDTKSFEVYWKSIHEKVKDKKIVYLSPDGVYNQLNVESFKLPGKKYVIDEMNVRVVGNTKSIAAIRSRDAKRAARRAEEKQLSAMLLGNPKYYESEQVLKEAKAEKSRGKTVSIISQLPGTEAEVKTINQLLIDNGWKIDSYLGKNATEEQIKQAQSYTLIHIATHGFFDDKNQVKKQPTILADDSDNPLERAGIITEGGGDVILKATKNYNIDDGVLTANEAMNLNFEDTELIVLSACETGRGEVQQGEGVFGLQRSFLVAGADAIVMSLFKVSDEVTQMLMVEFYKNWLSGQDKRTAFNKAQLKIKESYSSPIYWGAFTMIAKS
ncbi:MAG: CHAT domain-containing tetratricopeptide repeat protein, partial [Bacteroidota bacterium]